MFQFFLLLMQSPDLHLKLHLQPLHILPLLSSLHPTCFYSFAPQGLSASRSAVSCLPPCLHSSFSLSLECSALLSLDGELLPISQSPVQIAHLCFHSAPETELLPLCWTPNCVSHTCSLACPILGGHGICMSGLPTGQVAP